MHDYSASIYMIYIWVVNPYLMQAYSILGTVLVVWHDRTGINIILKTESGLCMDKKTLTMWVFFVYNYYIGFFISSINISLCLSNFINNVDKNSFNHFNSLGLFARHFKCHSNETKSRSSTNSNTFQDLSSATIE